MHLEAAGRPQRIGETHVEKKPKWWVVSEGFNPLCTGFQHHPRWLMWLFGISEPSTVVSWVVEPTQLKNMTHDREIGSSPQFLGVSEDL